MSNIAEPLPPTSADGRGDDAFATVLSDQAIEELATATREDAQLIHDAMAGQMDAEAPSHDAPKRRRPPIGPGPNNRFGISDVARCLKNGVVCYHCGSKLSKGDVRFEYTFAMNKPPRSIHPDCLTQIDGFALNGSINFLENLMETCPPADPAMRDACENALTVFKGLRDLHNA